MNEKIKELAEQAGYKPLPGFDFANSLQEVFLEKFGQLLLKEIIAIISVEDSKNQLFTDYSYNKGYYDGRMDAVQFLKDYFGVEQ